MADDDTGDSPSTAEDPLAEQRRQLAALCKSAKTRTSIFTREAPCDWNPESVINPETGEPFTEAAAWLLVACALDGGCRIEVVELRKPKGSKGYVVRLDGGASPEIYVKLQFGSRRVIGRSFHYTYF